MSIVSAKRDFAPSTRLKVEDNTISNDSTPNEDSDWNEIDFQRKNQPFFFLMVLYVSTSANAGLKIDGEVAETAPTESKYAMDGKTIVTLNSAINVAPPAGESVQVVTGYMIPDVDEDNNWSFRWSQNVAEVSDTKILAGSFMITWDRI